MNQWQWHLDHGVWRVTSPLGVHYRLEWKGGTWVAKINRRASFPTYLGTFTHASEGKAACMDHERNAAGTVDRESDMRVEVRT